MAKTETWWVIITRDPVFDGDGAWHHNGAMYPTYPLALATARKECGDGIVVQWKIGAIQLNFRTPRCEQEGW
jgi:hypothetical protein